MDRRDFLLLRKRGPERVLELSCERLYMRWADARSGAGALEEAERPGVPSWEGEPPTQITTVSPQSLLDELEGALAGADVLRLRDPRWLADPVFAAEVEARVDAFRARGGIVE
jgi:hypothetical protein